MGLGFVMRLPLFGTARGRACERGGLALCLGVQSGEGKCELVGHEECLGNERAQPQAPIVRAPEAGTRFM